jgi:insertion element IS1 protein InsB
VALCGFKKNKLWILKALDRGTRRTVAWVLGDCDTATFKKLYDKVKHLTNCIFYTDDWDAFAKVLPKEHHIMVKNTPPPLNKITVIRAIIWDGLHGGQKWFLSAILWLIPR